MDGVDVALVESDGEARARGVPGAHLTLSYTGPERDILFKAVATALRLDGREAAHHSDVSRAAKLSATRHAQALTALIDQLEHRPDVIGYHGQTVLHRPDPANPAHAFTLQVGDAQLLADTTQVPVVHDLRTADVEAGGQGAPLAPLYHQALLASANVLPAVILNLGGIANITLVQSSDPTTLIASDVGPANVFMDDLMMAREGRPFDENGALAAQGSIDDAVVAVFFNHPFFKQGGPKSLDRYSFPAPNMDHLSTQDAMATLAKLTVESVRRALQDLPIMPQAMFVAGGGVRNDFVMQALQQVLPCTVASLDSLGASAAMLEAEAFGYLAIRHVRGLPTSYPSTTGVPQPIVGGKLARPQ